MTDRVSRLLRILDDLSQQGHTGSILIHMAQGQPNVVEVPRAPSIRFPLTEERAKAHP